MKSLAVITLISLLTVILGACGGKSDADIQKEVQSRVNTPGVTSTVKDGVVTLSGTVQTQDQSKAAEAAAKVEGVKSVTNNLQIKPAPTPMMPTTTTPMSPNAPMSNGNMRQGNTARPATGAPR